jgi:hypothetical protein
VRCGRCGNENSEANRFCGMCGAALVAKTDAPGTAVRATVTPAEKKAEPGLGAGSADSRSVARSVSEATPVASPRANNSPTSGPPKISPSKSSSQPITGPSFLGLNAPPAGPSAGQSRPHADSPHGHDALRSSGNLDYLLEDEEEGGKWSRGKFALIVVALMLVAGFGYLRWKQGGFDWLTKGDGKPASAAQSANPAPSSAESGSAASAAPSPAGTSPDAATSGATTPPATTESAPQATPAQTPAPQSSSPQAAPPQTAPTDSKPPVDSASPPAGADSNTPPPQAEAPAVVKPRERKPTPVKPADPVSEAERYIYGRGVRQDCDRGMRLLKPAAEQSNPKAMISLGAVYSTGTCTPRDLPTAYRWFALALHKQPDNAALQDDLQKLWSQMTQPERQLAIKLSQ